MESHNSLGNLRLGDIVVLPDGTSTTARGKTVFEIPVGTMAGFIICGELKVLLGSPNTEEAPVNIYVSIDQFPSALNRARVAAEGAMRYWAPHLPSLGGAMGELTYRVLQIRGSSDPVVIIYRGDEAIVFIRATQVNRKDLRIFPMDSSVRNEINVQRQTGVINAPDRSKEEEKTLYETFANNKTTTKISNSLNNVETR